MAAAAETPAWAGLIERLARGLDRGGSRQWTAARKRDSLQRVLDGSGGDQLRLHQRLLSLLTAWESDAPAASEALVDETPAAVAEPGARPEVQPVIQAASLPWPPLAATLEQTVQAALPVAERRSRALADRLALLASAIAERGATPVLVAEVDAVCREARRLFEHRHRLFDELALLCRELGAGMTELAEDESWALGQSQNLQARLAEGLNLRGVRAAATLLADTRQRQQHVRSERNAARDALKLMIQHMLQELGELGRQTGRFNDKLDSHVKAVEQADSLESLAGVVRHLVGDGRAVQAIVSQAQARLQTEHAKASELQARVRDLESELRRLSEEATTDALTQVANRRGLALAFDNECARMARDTLPDGPGPMLSVALIDIDNFKKLNDSLGHSAGDVALKTLAAAVRERLRPSDHLARFGGEEFVVLLPHTAAVEAQQVLTRLQRGLSASLFMHDGQEVFVTFSAGVTAWQPGEALDGAIERADEALYEAKRTGKNRTCLA